MIGGQMINANEVERIGDGLLGPCAILNLSDRTISQPLHASARISFLN